jgi:hypothetical protein
MREVASNPDAIPPKRAYRRTRYFAAGELSRLCLDALRKADDKPIAAGEIAKTVIAEKGLPADVSTVLRGLRKRGTVVKHGTSRDAQWQNPRNVEMK